MDGHGPERRRAAQRARDNGVLMLIYRNKNIASILIDQWATKAETIKRIHTLGMYPLEIYCARRNRTHGPQLRRLLLYPTELLAQTRQRRSIKQGFQRSSLILGVLQGLGRAGGMSRAGGASRRRIHGRKGASAIALSG